MHVHLCISKEKSLANSFYILNLPEEINIDEYEIENWEATLPSDDLIEAENEEQALQNHKSGYVFCNGVGWIKLLRKI
jgi:hypothetical protein